MARALSPQCAGEFRVCVFNTVGADVSVAAALEETAASACHMFAEHCMPTCMPYHARLEASMFTSPVLASFHLQSN
jgi:hypothetical protein